MAKCSYCNSTIIIGGVRDEELRFCNQKCRQEGALLRVAQLIPEIEVRNRVASIHQGPCPKCLRMGATDVHTSYSVWSALILTNWKSSLRISCVPCGKKAKIKATVSSLFLGWWGFPWGLVLTPVQISRNLFGLVATPPTSVPSPQLERIVRLGLAAELRLAGAAGGTPPLLTKP